jgi:adenosine deaminase
LNITINSDDPPMFNTTLTDEYLRITDQFGFSLGQIKRFIFNAIEASLLSLAEKQVMKQDFVLQFEQLETSH